MLKLCRSSYFQLTLFLQILYGILVVGFFISCLILGLGLHPMLQYFYQTSKPINQLNNILIYWFIFEFILRLFTQKYPTINLKPFLIIPIKKKSIINYFILRTLPSVFNFILLSILAPFTIVAFKAGLNSLNLLGWLSAIALIVLINHYLVLFIKKSNTSYWVFLFLVSTFVILYYHSVDLTYVSFAFFNSIYYQPVLSLFLLLLLFLIYAINFAFFRKNFHLSAKVSIHGSSIKIKVKENILEKIFGKSSVFLKNDFRLIYRNAKPRQQVLTGFFSILYGFIFAIDKINNDFPVMLVFTCTVVTGGFLYTFAQLIPSWESSYYKLLMCLNISFQEYLKAKWYLMVIFIVFFFIACIPFIYFGVDKLMIIAVTAIFNIGINTFFTLYIGAFSIKKIALNERLSIFDTNGFNSGQIVLGSLKFALPVIIFYPIYKLFGFNVGLITLTFIGILGITYRDKLLEKIKNKYLDRKYRSIAALKENT